MPTGGSTEEMLSRSRIAAARRRGVTLQEQLCALSEKERENQSQMHVLIVSFSSEQTL